MSAPNPAHMTPNSYFGAFHSVWVHLGLFHYGSKLGTKRTELVQLMQKLMPWSHIGIICNKCTDSLHWILNSCFGAFRCGWVHFESSCYRRKFGAKRAELVLLIQKFMLQSFLRIFATNAPHWTPNSCFVAFCSVWVHLDPFRHCFKLDAKWTELVQLMQKYMPRSRVGICQNERTRSNLLDQNSCFVVFRSVWVHLGSFCYCMKLDAKCAKLVQLMQKFMPWSHIEIIHKECTRSTSMDPKLMFCCISYCLGALGAISLLHESRCKIA